MIGLPQTVTVATIIWGTLLQGSMSEPELPVTYEGTVTNSTDSEYTKALLRDKHELLIDEPTNLEVGAGTDNYPSPVDYMAVSLAACQVSVLSQALERARVEEFEVTCDYEIDRTGSEPVDEEMRKGTGVRVEHIQIDLSLEVPEEHEKRAQRCLDAYDTGCIVGQSFLGGVDYTPETELLVRDE